MNVNQFRQHWCLTKFGIPPVLAVLCDFTFIASVQCRESSISNHYVSAEKHFVSFPRLLIVCTLSYFEKKCSNVKSKVSQIKNIFAQDCLRCMSRDVRKRDFCLCREKKGAVQLCSTIPLLPKFQASSLFRRVYRQVCVGHGRKHR